MFPVSSGPERPVKPPRAVKNQPSPPLFAAARRRLKRVLLQGIDRGWFGFVPLQAHLVICGFPRSGTTLLQLMAETAYPGARTFGVERSGLGAAHNDLPGDTPLIVSKDPDDIFWVDEIRASYAERRTRTRVRFIVTIRDPRAVLTSVHDMNRDVYWVSVERWRAIYLHYCYVREFPDVLVVEYSDIVLDPLKVQRRLAATVGIEPSRGFTEFQDAVPGQFDTRALNGVRPLDPAALNKWRSPRHRERIRQLLDEMPELPDRLIEMGYEPDTRWTEAYA